jgi:hypothetical protein
MKVQDGWKAGLVFGNLNVSGWRITMATPERPSFIAHWSEIERPDDSHYDEDVR